MKGPIKLKVTPLHITPNAAEVVEQIAAISYITQRFSERISPAKVVFKSGRTLPLSELKLNYIPKPGDIIPGFTKDDQTVALLREPSSFNVVRWLRKLGHLKPFEVPTATFKIEGLSRKSTLHYLRYEFISTNMQSQKYHPQDQFNYVLPEPGEESPEVIAKLVKCMENIQGMYEDLRAMGADPEWARGVYPNLTAQVWTISTNLRQWRHILSCLVPEEYVGENQKLAITILKLLKNNPHSAIFFEDFVEQQDKSWKVPSANRNLMVNFSLGATEKRKLGIEVYTDEDIKGDIP